MLEARNLTARMANRELFGSLSLTLRAGEVLGLSGPSGCGKTTLGRILAALRAPEGGQVLLEGAPLPRRGVQPVQYLPQSPLAAMNPSWTIRRIVAEAGPSEPETARLLGIRDDWAKRRPHQLSGGQLQRVSILRALTARPRFLIADEITAQLDPVAQARIWKALTALMTRDTFGIVAISHDAALLDRIATTRLDLKDAARWPDRTDGRLPDRS